MATKRTPLLFVDTNILLDFYRGGGSASLGLLAHLETATDSLIMTDQVEAEFLNNRRNVISQALGQLTYSAPGPSIPAYLSDSKTADGIEKGLSQIRKRVQLLKARFARILSDPYRYDPVFKAVKGVITKTNRLNLKTRSREERAQIMRSALERFQRGFPPRKRDANSSGDSINWEWIIACAESEGRDVLLVSRDQDFGLTFDGNCYLNDFLAQEFKERVSSKRHSELVPSLAQALKKMSVKVTAAEEKEEQTIILGTIKAEDIHRKAPSARRKFDLQSWRYLLERVKQRSAFTHTYLEPASSAVIIGNELIVSFPPDKADHIDLVNNAKTHALLTSIVKDIGYGECRVRFLKLDQWTADAQEHDKALAEFLTPREES